MPQPPTADRTARALSERMDALARALRDAGADPEAASRLLGTAAAAAMDAVALDLLRAGPAPPQRAEPAAAAAGGARELRLAA